MPAAPSLPMRIVPAGRPARIAGSWPIRRLPLYSPAAASTAPSVSDSARISARPMRPPAPKMAILAVIWSAVLRDHRVAEAPHRVDLLLKREGRVVDVPRRGEDMGGAHLDHPLHRIDVGRIHHAGMDLERLVVGAVFFAEGLDGLDHRLVLLHCPAGRHPAVAQPGAPAQSRLGVAADQARHPNLWHPP